MAISIAYLGPTGTHTEAAALAYAHSRQGDRTERARVEPYPSIACALRAVDRGEMDLAVVPVENSTQGSVSVTLDSLWQLDRLQIQCGLVLPIAHALLSHANSTEALRTVYSHPQALAQCQNWLEERLPAAQLVPTRSTTEALRYLDSDLAAAAIASPRSSTLYNIPILAAGINDYPENCTRFLVLGLDPSPGGTHLSLAFSIPANVPGSLVKPLSILAERGINLKHIESRPIAHLVGEYLFFIDVEGNCSHPHVREAMAELPQHVEILKVFGNYDLLCVSYDRQTAAIAAPALNRVHP